MLFHFIFVCLLSLNSVLFPNKRILQDSYSNSKGSWSRLCLAELICVSYALSNFHVFVSFGNDFYVVWRNLLPSNPP
jgi:hypothetical protein